MAGNVEAAKTCHVKIDTVAPSTTLGASKNPYSPGPPPIYAYPVTFTLTAGDNAGGSGVAQTWMMTQQPSEVGGWETLTPWTQQTSVTYPAGWRGDIRISYYSVDAAGNTEGIRQFDCTVWSPPPS